MNFLTTNFSNPKPAICLNIDDELLAMHQLELMCAEFGADPTDRYAECVEKLSMAATMIPALEGSFLTIHYDKFYNTKDEEGTAMSLIKECAPCMVGDLTREDYNDMCYNTIAELADPEDDIQLEASCEDLVNLMGSVGAWLESDDYGHVEVSVPVKDALAHLRDMANEDPEPCDCKSEWTWDADDGEGEQTHYGCSYTTDDEHPWCDVVDPDACYALDIDGEIIGDDKEWRYCVPDEYIIDGSEILAEAVVSAMGDYGDYYGEDGE